MRACRRFSCISAPELERNGREYLDNVGGEFARVRATLDRYLKGRNAAVS
jgi:hypothetical protein